MLLFRLFIVPLLGLLIVTSSYANKFDDGMAAYNQGDYKTAFSFLYPLAERGDADAQNNIGFMYSKGHGVPQDSAMAAYWIRKAAEQGHINAQHSTAWRYYVGEGVPRDYSQAVYWYSKVAEQGVAVAQNKLAWFYRHGKGVPQDYSKAVYWNRKAAEQGLAYAQFDLSLLYGSGEGVPQDHTKAAYWCRKAAEQGDSTAQYNLGIFYDIGKGVPEDDVIAYKWFNLAGFEAANELRADIAKHMTRSQIAEAQRLSRNFKPHKETATPQKTESIHRDTAKKTVGITKKQIASMQKTLKSMGYYTGTIDGLRGPNTRRAVRAFQQDSGIQITGKIDSKLIAQLDLLKGIAGNKSSQPQLSSTGSGFLINDEGYVVTNYHVIKGCKTITSPMLGNSGFQIEVNSSSKKRSTTARIVASSSDTDIAILDFPGTYSNYVRFRINNKIGLAESVLVAGFPLRGLLADDLNVATGEVSALSGLGSDATNIQISAPVQPGNSGGPLLDKSGNVIGVVVSKLNAIEVAKKTGDIPQNINFAVKGAAAKYLLDINGVKYHTSSTTKAIATTKIAAQAKQYTVVLECWK